MKHWLKPETNKAHKLGGEFYQIIKDPGSITTAVSQQK